MSLPGRKGETVWALTGRRFLKHRLAVVSLGVLAGLALAALSAPLAAALIGADASAVDLFNRFQGSSWAHPLGTDAIGRDILVRLLYGGRISLIVGLTAAFASAVIGTMVGLLAGYYGGRIDAFLMRTTDGVIALPLLPLLIVLAALDLGKIGLPEALATSENISLYRIIVIVALVGWTTSARLVRGAALSIRERDFVLAARAQGASAWRIVGVHILPNLVSPIIVATPLSAGKIILLESVLSFLGLGIQEPMTSWGVLISEGAAQMESAPWTLIFPATFLAITLFSLNFVGDGLRDALDPKDR